MSIKNILVSTILLILGIYNLTQAEIIRGVDVSRVDTDKIVGKWFLLTVFGSPSNNQTLCINFEMKKLSDDIFTMEATPSHRENADGKPGVVPSDNPHRVMRCEIQNNSNVIMMNMNDRVKLQMVIFDVDYNTHMATFMTDTEEEMSDDSTGTLLMFTRGKSLPNSVIDRIKQSNFYQQGMDSRDKSELRIMNMTDCL